MTSSPATRVARSSSKAASAAECRHLRQIPNIGPAMVADFEVLGIRLPVDLVGADAFALYQRLCKLTGQRHDPCVLDTLMAAVDFMNGGPARDWWSYTAVRKAQYPDV
ncbi:helix-hairpin-helix domain-containing protein [Roseateles amylovorans]|uniref:Helix-hairpin-helix domain-containing protein n=1 Tax=Roseateles amylovorans TaxID=2978473 RepID=A0ABY6B4R2_9BURK|nr:helix-hairpin-helix domain-containing protein [Roseateles amylovorans]UXH80249.1 helix-hairpin-helix domain-containing protein [Roseateles amylovorans]